jgi:hypothetical protein
MEFGDLDGRTSDTAIIVADHSGVGNDREALLVLRSQFQSA